ncbi:MAG: DUF2339 domain-containing protein [Candidatus Muirbacterium halophilum]|nr:DUF2339 domain-containing protein [Candidatus Muirbacterium halophilum]MCK9474451.1 DUF2339 domain-containing protein [Candidatus Muirbacterium halophilum]
MICNNCNTENFEGAKFCKNCGNEFKSSNNQKDITDIKDNKISELMAEFNFGQKWILFAGIFFVLLSIGTFLKYTIELGLITPLVRVLLVYLTGIIFVVLGRYVISKNFRKYGVALMGAGLAILYSATYFGSVHHNIIPEKSAYIIMSGISLVTVFLAYLFDVKWILSLAIFGAYGTPMMFGIRIGYSIMFFIYILIANIGFLYISHLKEWKFSLKLLYISYFLLMIVWASNNFNFNAFNISYIFSILNYFVFVAIPIINYLFKNHKLQNITSQIVIGSVAFFCYNFYLINLSNFTDVVSGINSIIFAIIFGVFSLFLYKKGIFRPYAIPYIGLAISFLVFGLSSFIFANYITTTILIISIFMYWYGNETKKHNLEVLSFIGMLLSLWLFTFNDLNYYFHFSFSNLEFLSANTSEVIGRLFHEIVIIISMIAVLKINRYILKDKSTYNFFSIILFVFSIVILNVEVIGFFKMFSADSLHGALSVSWVIYSYILIFVGLKKDIPMFRYSAFGILGFTSLKVLLFDITNMNVMSKMLSFFLMGIVLLVTSFLYHKFSEKYIQKIE